VCKLKVKKEEQKVKKLKKEVGVKKVEVAVCKLKVKKEAKKVEKLKKEAKKLKLCCAVQNNPFPFSFSSQTTPATTTSTIGSTIPGLLAMAFVVVGGVFLLGVGGGGGG
jgi:hypothetical protein